LFITLSQILLACLVSGQPTPASAYLSLARWDSDWYGHIVDNGYVCPVRQTRADPGNTAFFPAYPLFTWLVKHAFGLDTRVALLVSAQLACWGFWTYLLLLCRHWRLPRTLTVCAIVLIAVHPTAYYLVAGYSEPLFLMCLVGFVYWSEQKGRTATLLAAVHGFLMTATRLVGLPLVIYPVLRAWLLPAPGPRGLLAALRRAALPCLVAVVSSLGALGFFAYCHARFGEWNLYMKTGQIGWGNRTDYLVPLRPGFYHLTSLRAVKMVYRIAQSQTRVDLLPVDHNAAQTVLLFFAALLLVEAYRALCGATGWRERTALYPCAAFLWYVPVCAAWHTNMAGTTRYMLCSQVVLALAAIHLLARVELHRSRCFQGVVAFAALISLTVQVVLIYRFTHGGWVA
jgi:hypothetical protein